MWVVITGVAEAMKHLDDKGALFANSQQNTISLKVTVTGYLFCPRTAATTDQCVNIIRVRVLFSASIFRPHSHMTTVFPVYSNSTD